MIGGTLDAKSIISKNKILPKISHIASAKAIPYQIKKRIDRILLNYIIPHSNRTIMTLKDLALPRAKGGYDIDDVILHGSIFLLSGVFKYIQKVVNGQPLSDYEYYIEYNVGWQICKYLGVRINIACPHRSRPNVIFKEILDIIKDNNISAELLIEGKVNLVYKSVISNRSVNRRNTRYLRLHDPIFPNYLKTFNFNAFHNLLPVKTLFRDFALDNDSACSFCDLHPDTIPHIFSQCVNLNILWNFLDEVLRLLNVNPEFFSFMHARKSCDFSLVTNTVDLTDRNYILYLNTVVNHNIWRYSKKIQHEHVQFDNLQIIKNVVKTLFARKRMEEKLKQCSKIDNMENLCTAANFVKNVFMQDMNEDDI